MRAWFKYLVLASLLFLLVALYRADYLQAPEFVSVPAVLASLALLFLGLLGDAMSWHTLLRRTGIQVKPTESLAGAGLSVFGKYIPGRIWLIVGRSAYVAERHSYSLTQLTSTTVTWQLMMIWLCLMFGAFGLFLLDGLHAWGWIILFMWIGLTVLIFSSAAQSIAQEFAKRVLKNDLRIPKLPAATILGSLPWFFLTLASISFGFYLFVQSMSLQPVPLTVGFGLPLGLSIGIISFFTPSGLGVREGVVVAYLTLAGLTIAEATTISIAARLWFIVGEVFFFLAGAVANAVVKRAER